MLRIRLRRTGARKKPQYRVVVAESTSPRDGRYVEIIGTYNPLTNPSTVNINTERAQHWLSVGATPSVRVHKLLAGVGVMEPPAFVTAAKAADGAATDDTSGGATAASTAGVATEAATSAAMAPAVEEAGASGPIPDVDETEAASGPDTEATTETATEATTAASADASTTPDAASEAV
ncbi:MAG: 30S ribosomal protein S16 [Chloroflexota bacterium]|nr:30S ribosomal protein S16 [Chloroflexota bacterium]